MTEDLHSSAPVEPDLTETAEATFKSTDSILNDFQKKIITKSEPIEKGRVPESQSKENKSNSQPKEISTDDDSDTVSLSKAELAKREKAAEETKLWGTELSRKLKSFEYKLAKYVEEGILTDEEAEEFKKDVQHEQREQEQEPTLMKYIKVWDAEIENLRKYTEDPLLDKKIHAFQHFLQNSSPEEINEVMESFKDVEGDSVALTKKMLAVAAKYSDEIFSEIYEAGNLKNFKKKYQNELEKKQNNIDKLEKEVLRLKKEYEDYSPSSTMSLPNGSTDSFPDAKPRKMLSTDQILEEKRRQMR